jgi:hypothetical protein
MQLSAKVLNDLRAAYRADFGDEITEAEATAIGNRLLHLVEILRQHLLNNGDHSYGTSGIDGSPDRTIVGV